MYFLSELCVKRPVFALMLIAALVVAGLVAFPKLGVDRYPSMDMPTITVRCVYPGAASVEVEAEVSQVLEDAVATVAGIEELRSISSDGTSLLLITFNLNRNFDAAVQDVRDAVSSVLNRLPPTIDPPIIQKQDTDSSPVMSLAVSGPRTPSELYMLADRYVKNVIESAPGVGQVTIAGSADRAVQVNIDARRLAAHQLSILQVREALQRQNVEVPGGRVDEGTRERSLRTLGRVTYARNFPDLVVSSGNHATVRLSDLGEVRDATKEVRTIARLNGSPAVVLQVQRQSGENTVRVIDAVKQRLPRSQTLLPDDVQVTVIQDQSRYILAALHEIEGHLISGSILACLTVLLFMRSWRSTLIAAVAIPTSIIATFAFMKLCNFTLNNVTMLALVLMVGVVIDDAIVVLENVFRCIEEEGMEPYAASIQGTREIGLAVLSTTISLVIVFLPVSFLSSVTGRMLFQFGVTATVAILVSMFVSFTLTPMMCSRLLRPIRGVGTPALNDERSDRGVGTPARNDERSDRGVGTPARNDERSDRGVGTPARNDERSDRGVGTPARNDERSECGVGTPARNEKSGVATPATIETNVPRPNSRGGFYAWIETFYLWCLTLSLRYRPLVLILSLLVIASNVWLYQWVKQDYIPTNVDESEFEVSLTAGEGTNLSSMNECMMQVEQLLSQVDGVEILMTTVGTRGFGGVNRGDIYVRLTDIEQRSFSLRRLWHCLWQGDPGAAFRNNYTQRQKMDEVRQLVKTVPGVRASVRNLTSLRTGAPVDIDFSITGTDVAALAAFSEKLREKAMTLPGIVDVDTTLRTDKPELLARIDRERAAALGIDAQEIADTLRIAVGGDDRVSRYRDLSVDDAYDVELRLVGVDRRDVDSISQLYVRARPSLSSEPQAGTQGTNLPTPGTALTRIDNVVEFESNNSLARIDRLDRQRMVAVRANVAPGFALADRIAAMQAAAEEIGIPLGFETRVLGRGRELERTLSDFVVTFALSFVFMYIVLAAQFENLMHPITILMSLPLAVPFGLISLYWGGETLNLYSALGILVLFGVVKKASILQIDHTNNLRAKGMDRHQATLIANRDRLRPILMTTISFVAGLLPLLIATGPGAEERRSIAVLVVGGQTLSLLLTLLAVPVIYTYLDDMTPRSRVSPRLENPEAHHPA